MKDTSLTIKRYKESKYGNLIQNIDEEMVYCELEYKRDRSSFAGVVFKITNEKNKFEFCEVIEKKIKEISKYENIYIGCDEDYMDSIKEIFFSTEKEYGIKVFFIVYSDLRSSQIVFEDLMKKIEENINEIQKSII